MPQYLAEIEKNLFTMQKEEARHLKVARIHTGAEIKVFDGKGNKYLAILSQLTDKSACGEIIKTLPAPHLKRAVHLYFSAVARAAAEDIIDKCTQAGVSRFVPVLSRYSEKDLLKKWSTKHERWNQLALAACKQCENPSVPIIEEPVTFEDAIKNLSVPALICYEDERKTPLLSELNALGGEAAIFIGPEGGYAEEEVALAKKYNIRPVTLGQNILRAETAAAVACWAAQQ